MKLSPVRILLVLLFVFIGCFGVAYAAAGMLTALPAPAIGGTCGPSTGSETALEALAEPGSIGAGPEPSDVQRHGPSTSGRRSSSSARRWPTGGAWPRWPSSWSRWPWPRSA